MDLDFCELFSPLDFFGQGATLGRASAERPRVADSPVWDSAVSGIHRSDSPVGFTSWIHRCHTHRRRCRRRCRADARTKQTEGPLSTRTVSVQGRCTFPRRLGDPGPCPALCRAVRPMRPIGGWARGWAPQNLARSPRSGALKIFHMFCVSTSCRGSLLRKRDWRTFIFVHFSET
jgi:hypothetical protein